MVPVSYVHARYQTENLRYAFDCRVIVNHPELVAEAVQISGKVIERLFGGYLGHDSVKVIAVGVGEEHRLHVSVAGAHVFHPVLFLVLARQLMLFDSALHVVRHVGAHHKSVLRAAVHGLRINIIASLGIFHQPAVCAELLEVLQSLLIHARVMLISARLKVYLGLNDVVEAFLIVAGLGPGLFRIKNIVGA